MSIFSIFDIFLLFTVTINKSSQSEHLQPLVLGKCLKKCLILQHNYGNLRAEDKSGFSLLMILTEYATTEKYCFGLASITQWFISYPIHIDHKRSSYGKTQVHMYFVHRRGLLSPKDAAYFLSFNGKYVKAPRVWFGHKNRKNLKIPKTSK